MLLPIKEVVEATCAARSSPLGIQESCMAPNLAGAKHGVDGARELTRSRNASDTPVESGLELVVVLR
jgi:hypothetical protein